MTACLWGDKLSTPAPPSGACHDNIARRQLGPQAVLNIRFKGRTIHCTFEDKWGMDATQGEGGHTGVPRAGKARGRFHHPLAGRGPSIAGRHAQVGAHFIDKMQLIGQRRQQVAHALRKGGTDGHYPLGFPLAVVDRLFFRGKRKWVSSRDTMLPLTFSPNSVWRRSRNSSSEISGWAFTAA